MHLVEKLVSLDYNRGFSKDIPSVDRHKACSVPLKTGVPEVNLLLTIHYFCMFHFRFSHFPNNRTY